MTDENIVENEWVYEIESETAGNDLKEIRITPPSDAFAPLESRLNILKLASLSADLKFQRQQGNMVIYVSGIINAKITQGCVVTLEPIHTDINEKFEAWYADSDHAVSLNKVKRLRELEEEYGSETPILDEKDDPEPIVDGKIDIGELVIQYLSLAINPYPQAEGAHYELGDDKPTEEIPNERKNPFAALKDWKHKLQNEE